VRALTDDGTASNAPAMAVCVADGLDSGLDEGADPGFLIDTIGHRAFWAVVEVVTEGAS